MAKKSFSAKNAARSVRLRALVNPAEPARSGADPVRIFQIFYRPQQRAYLDPAFEPCDNAGDASPLLEFNVFDKLARQEHVRQSRLWGALSWKFGQKTGMTGAGLREAIAANPGYDVYFCNPHADTEALYHNLWVQGETAHPNFIVLCREFFQVTGLPESLLTEMQPSADFATANYFVATTPFWDAYLSFVRGLLEAAEQKLSPTALAILHSPAADQNGMHANATYLPFLVERLFSVFLRTAGRGFNAFKVALPEQDGQANVHLKLLADMKDVACRTRSCWLAACWVNYRNLYLAALHKESWVRRYLKSITPDTVAFAAEAARITVGHYAASSAGGQSNVREIRR